MVSQKEILRRQQTRARQSKRSVDRQLQQKALRSGKSVSQIKQEREFQARRSEQEQRIKQSKEVKEIDSIIENQRQTLKFLEKNLQESQRKKQEAIQRLGKEYNRESRRDNLIENLRVERNVENTKIQEYKKLIRTARLNVNNLNQIRTSVETKIRFGRSDEASKIISQVKKGVLTQGEASRIIAIKAKNEKNRERAKQKRKSLIRNLGDVGLSLEDLSSGDIKIENLSAKQLKVLQQKNLIKGDMSSSGFDSRIAKQYEEAGFSKQESEILAKESEIRGQSFSQTKANQILSEKQSISKIDTQLFTPTSFSSGSNKEITTISDLDIKKFEEAGFSKQESEILAKEQEKRKQSISLKEARRIIQNERQKSFFFPGNNRAKQLQIQEAPEFSEAQKFLGRIGFTGGIKRAEEKTLDFIGTTASIFSFPALVGKEVAKETEFLEIARESGELDLFPTPEFGTVQDFGVSEQEKREKLIEDLSKNLDEKDIESGLFFGELFGGGLEIRKKIAEEEASLETEKFIEKQMEISKNKLEKFKDKIQKRVEKEEITLEEGKRLLQEEIQKEQDKLQERAKSFAEREANRQNRRLKEEVKKTKITSFALIDIPVSLATGAAIGLAPTSIQKGAAAIFIGASTIQLPNLAKEIQREGDFSELAFFGAELLAFGSGAKVGGKIRGKFIDKPRITNALNRADVITNVRAKNLEVLKLKNLELSKPVELELRRAIESEASVRLIENRIRPRSTKDKAIIPDVRSYFIEVVTKDGRVIKSFNVGTLVAKSKGKTYTEDIIELATGITNKGKVTIFSQQISGKFTKKGFEPKEIAETLSETTLKEKKGGKVKQELFLETELFELGQKKVDQLPKGLTSKFLPLRTRKRTISSKELSKGIDDLFGFDKTSSELNKFLKDQKPKRQADILGEVKLNRRVEKIFGKRETIQFQKNFLDTLLGSKLSKDISEGVFSRTKELSRLSKQERLARRKEINKRRKGTKKRRKGTKKTDIERFKELITGQDVKTFNELKGIDQNFLAEQMFAQFRSRGKKVSAKQIKRDFLEDSFFEPKRNKAKNKQIQKNMQKLSQTENLSTGTTQKSTLSFAERASLKLRQKDLLLGGQKSIKKISISEKQREKLLQDLKSDIRLDKLTSQELSTKQIPKQVVSQDTTQKTKQKQLLSQDLKLNLGTGLGTDFNLFNVKLPEIKVPKLAFVEGEEDRKQEFKRRNEPTHLFVRERGKRIKVTKDPITRKKAKDLGAYIVDKTLSAEYKLKKTKGKIKEPEINPPLNYQELFGFKFRKFRKRRKKQIPVKNTYIERQQHRLDTPEEVSKITVNRLLKQERKRNKQLNRFNKNFKNIFGMQNKNTKKNMKKRKVNTDITKVDKNLAKALSF